VLTPAGPYKLSGDPGGRFWYVSGLCRFEPGELDPYLAELHRKPFVPLLFRLSNGCEHVVTHPDLVLVGRSTLNIGSPASDSAGVYDHYEIVSILHLTQIVPLSSAAAKALAWRDSLLVATTGRCGSPQVRRGVTFGFLAAAFYFTLPPEACRKHGHTGRCQRWR
jgi:hypothetical protein